MSEIQLNPHLWKDDGGYEFPNFHTRCLVDGNVCGLTIDNRSFVNVVNTWLVERLNLKTLKHPNPYHMRNECGKLMVSEQVLLAFSIGKYQDEVLCDVAPMQSSHILFGKPWQFDRRAKHDDYNNRYSFVMNKRRVNLKALQPLKAFEDQLTILEQYRKREKEKNERKEIEEDVKVKDSITKDDEEMPPLQESESEEEIDKDESIEGTEKQESFRDEEEENKNKGEIKSDVCFSTNDLNFSFPCETASSLQGLQDMSSPEIPVESSILRDLIPLSDDSSEKERAALIKQQTNQFGQESYEIPFEQDDWLQIIFLK